MADDRPAAGAYLQTARAHSERQPLDPANRERIEALL
jgi:hypothetical protein